MYCYCKQVLRRSWHHWHGLVRELSTLRCFHPETVATIPILTHSYKRSPIGLVAETTIDSWPIYQYNKLEQTWKTRPRGDVINKEGHRFSAMPRFFAEFDVNHGFQCFIAEIAEILNFAVFPYFRHFFMTFRSKCSYFGEQWSFKNQITILLMKTLIELVWTVF